MSEAGQKAADTCDEEALILSADKVYPDMEGRSLTDAVTGRLAGKTVVVTGAARGQGRAESLLFDRAGARVIACDLHFERSLPASITTRTFDVSDPQGWSGLAGFIEQECGGTVDGLVNNAGIPWRSRLLEIRLEDWNHVFAVNCTGMLLGIQTLGPLMRAGASVVNIGSVAGFVGFYAAAYSVSKWAVRGLSAVAAMELGERGIRVNSIHPGFIETEMTATAPASLRQATAAISPMPRVGHVDDVAHTVLFLLTDDSGFINGAEITVDGGQVSTGGAKVISDLARNS